MPGAELVELILEDVMDEADVVRPKLKICWKNVGFEEEELEEKIGAAGRIIGAGVEGIGFLTHRSGKIMQYSS